MGGFYLTNYSDNTVTPLVDLSPETEIAVGNGPQSVAFTPDGTTAYVTMYSDDAVTPIDAATGAVGTPIAVGAGPIWAAFTPDGAKAYVCNNTDNTVSVIDVGAATVTTTIAVGTQPQAVAVTPDGTKAYVCNNSDATVTPIDVATDTAGAPFSVGTFALSVLFTPDGLKAYVGLGDGTLIPIDVATDTPGSPFAVGENPVALAITPDGATVYTCNQNDDNVTPVDTASDTPAATIAVGSFPSGIAITDDGVTLVVTNFGDVTVTPIDTATATPATAVAVPGTGPFGIAFSPLVGASVSSGTQRVGIAFDDGPHEPDPTWTWLDSDPSFPDQFVSGYDTRSGRETLLSQTDTGTATVYINDHELGLFDPRNSSSPYYTLLDGKQILLQLYDPVTEVWEPQWRGWIDFATYDIDGSAVDANGDPINASIQLECVDMFDQLGGYGLTPGLDGVRPPSGMEDGVYYAETAGTVDDRIIEILADVGIDSTRYIVASGNVSVIAVKYDPDESALVALRDACDAELPFIANMYVNRHGQFVFRGRYSRFYPDEVAAEPGSEWDFTRWVVGDGAAITADSTRAQMRVLSYTRGRQDIINVAICFPQGIEAAKMPNQVFADGDSIDSYGRHNAPPMSDLLTLQGTGTTSTWDKFKLCFRYAKLLVRNKQGPHIAVSRLQVKTVHPDDVRAPTTWAFLTRSDISHIVNVAVGYPGGTGLTGNSPADDHYIEGRSLVVRPLDPGFDYVELDCEVTPFAWSADTHNVFPPFSGDTPIMAEFTYAYEGDPGTVDFTDTSTEGPSGPITAWAWDFGDGGTDTVENPTYVYAANGTYEVTLTVTGTGGDGTDSDSRLVKITDV